MTDDWTIGSYYIFKNERDQSVRQRTVRESGRSSWFYKIKREVSEHSRFFSLISDNAAMVILLSPIPSLVVYILTLRELAFQYTLCKITIVKFSFCYLIISFAYFKVYQIIRRHQLQTQASVISQNFDQPAIDLAKYKKSVATMLYIFLLLSMCFLPFFVSSVLSLLITGEVKESSIDLSMVLVFLSSSLNPGLYLWRMRDIRRGLKPVNSY